MPHPTIQGLMHPGHCFHFDGAHYAINLRNMLASRISPTTAGLFEALRSGKAVGSGAAGMEQLERLRFFTAPHRDAQASSGQSASSSDGVGKNSGDWTGGVATLILFVTQTCNLRCVYCYGKGGEYGMAGVMSEETARRTLDWFFQGPGPSDREIAFFGGEPFLNFPLMRFIVTYARKQAHAVGGAVKFSATTNMTALDEEKIQFIRDNDLNLVASFDGPKPLLDRLRPSRDGSSTYDRICAVLPEVLAGREDKVNARATLVAQSDPREVLDEIFKVGFKRAHMTRAAPSLFLSGEEREDPGLLAELDRKIIELTEEQVKEVLAALRARDEERVRRLTKLLPASLPSRGDLFENGIACLSKRSFFCGVGRGQLAVGVLGDVYPCHRFVGQERFRLGSIYDAEPFDTGKFRSSIESRSCSVCWARHICGGGCLHENVAESLEEGEPSERTCAHQRRLAELTIVLWANVSREDYGWMEEHGIVSSANCPLDLG